MNDDCPNWKICKILSVLDSKKLGFSYTDI
jgi:hypothetical protein